MNTLNQIDRSVSHTTGSHASRQSMTVHKLAQSESGMLAWGTILGVFVLLIMFSLVANSVDTVTRKIETQNAADSVAYSSTVWLARGMNAVTATNHIIGELNAMYTLHHALGGKYLDENTEENDRSDLEGLNTAIEVTFQGAMLGTPPALSLHKDKITENPVADLNSMLYRSKRQLKIIYEVALAAHVAGVLLANSVFPPTVAAGYLLQIISYAFEWKVYQEYLVLDGIEILAKGLKAPKKAIPTIISAVYLYQQGNVIGLIPFRSYESADKVAKLHGSNIKGFVRGDIPSLSGLNSVQGAANSLLQIYPKLPVEKEDTTREEKSQMLRATYPWVAHWRDTPVLFLKITCTLSGAGPKYRDWSNIYARQSSEFLRKSGTYKNQLTIENMEGQASGSGEAGKNIQLYVMLDLNKKNSSNEIDKSQEEWNEDSYSGAIRADTIFSIMGFASSPKPSIFSQAFFRQENPDGFVCYSQAILYNANPQQRPEAWKGSGGAQATVGWDTLNWTSNAMEWEWTDDDSGDPPTVKLNWQAKLTPLTHPKLLKVLASQAVFGDQNTRTILTNNREAQLLLQNH